MSEQHTEEMWRALFTGQHPDLRKGRRLFKRIPANPRCKLCYAPFRGIGAPFMRMMGKRPSNMNPHFCDICEQIAKTHPGGAEIELTLLFADVRGSTTLAERMSPAEFSRLLNRFYAAANDVLVRSEAFIDKLVGDEVIGLYFPGFIGPEHAGRAVHAAQELLRATGHGNRSGPWIPVGVGIHTGIAFVGAVGSQETVTDVTALGDAVNVAARLASRAGPGEALVSDAAYAAAALDLGNPERRQLDLKGRSEPVDVRVVTVRPT